MQEMGFINIDNWRVLNEPLFKAYVECYSDLELNPGKEKSAAMVEALTTNNNLLTVTVTDYLSFFVIARELGIFYEDAEGLYHLGNNARKYLKGELTYQDYLKYYILNSEFLIDNQIVHPFEIIIERLKNRALTLDELAQDLSALIPENLSPDKKRTAKNCLKTFIRRAVESRLLKLNDDKYSLTRNYNNVKRFISHSNMNVTDFKTKFIGGTKDKQENIVKEIINKEISEKIFDDYRISLNQILYGPPGTGKTDSTIEKSLEILDLLSSKSDESERRKENRETFRTLLNKRIFFVTMHPSYGYEDFVQGIKPLTEKGRLLFELKDGVFKVITDLASDFFKEEGEITVKNIDNKDILRVCFFLSKFNTNADKKANLSFGAHNYSQVFQIIGNKFDVNPNSVKNHRDKFDFLVSSERAGWRPQNGSDTVLDNTELWPYQDVYVELKDKSFEDVKAIVTEIEKKTSEKLNKKESNINFVLILDEINRANISKVFGELITLLENDKRIGADNELSVTLPSGKPFSIPPNLYVIGTMNTADRSIALVDIALRRRFQFIPVYPDSLVVDTFCKSADKSSKKEFMDNLNKILRKDKGVDFQIGHAYFLKDNSLRYIINENIIPLLTEFYRNDLEQVKKILAKVNTPVNEKYYEETGLLKYF